MGPGRTDLTVGYLNSAPDGSYPADMVQMYIGANGTAVADMQVPDLEESKRAPKSLQGNSLTTIVAGAGSMEMTTQSVNKSSVNVCRKEGFRRQGLMQVWFTRMLLL